MHKYIYYLTQGTHMQNWNKFNEDKFVLQDIMHSDFIFYCSSFFKKEMQVNPLNWLYDTLMVITKLRKNISGVNTSESG